MVVTYAEKNKGILTNSKLKDFDFCGALYLLEYGDIQFEGDESDEDSKALIFGKAFDSLEQGNSREASAILNNEEIIGKSRAQATQLELLTKCLAIMQDHPKYMPLVNPQYRIEKEYRGVKIGGTLDDLQLDRKNGDDETENLIIDTKTTASISRFRKYIESYRRQMAFYWLLVYLEHEVKCDAVLKCVTKKNPTAFMVKFTSDELEVLIPYIDEDIDKFKEGEFRRQTDQLVCANCKARDICPSRKKNQNKFLTFQDFVQEV